MQLGSIVRHAIRILVAVLYGKIIVRKRRKSLVMMPQHCHPAIRTGALWRVAVCALAMNECVLLLFHGPVETASLIGHGDVFGGILLKCLNALLNGLALDELLVTNRHILGGTSKVVSK